jgi:hypothetical protein
MAVFCNYRRDWTIILYYTYHTGQEQPDARNPRAALREPEQPRPSDP